MTEKKKLKWKLYFDNWETNYPREFKDDYIDEKDFSKSWDLASKCIEKIFLKNKKYSPNKVDYYLSFKYNQINSKDLIFTKYSKPTIEPKEGEIVVVAGCSDWGHTYFLFKGEDYFGWEQKEGNDATYYENISKWLLESDNFEYIFKLMENTYLNIDAIIERDYNYYIVITTREINENVQKFFNLYKIKYKVFNEIDWIKPQNYVWKLIDETNVNYPDLKTRREGEYYDKNGKFLKEKKIFKEKESKVKISLSEKFRQKDDCQVEYSQESEKNKLTLTYFNCVVDDDDQINLEYRFILNVLGVEINHLKNESYDEEEFFEVYEKNRKISKSDFRIEILDNDNNTTIDTEYELNKSARKQFQKLIDKFIEKYENI